MVEPAWDQRNLITELKDEFSRRHGRQTVSVRCDLCGNAEIASVRVIRWRGRAWRVYGTIREDPDDAAIVHRRLQQGWTPNALRAWILRSKGVDITTKATGEPVPARVRARGLHVEVLNLGPPDTKTLEAHCRTHGLFHVFRPPLLDEPEGAKPTVVRVGLDDQPHRRRSE